MAVLALLARAGERGMLRDKLQTLLWPDADADRASRTLAQALYALRKDLTAEGAIVGSKELRFDPALVGSDVTEFAAAMTRGDHARAVELYSGPFLDGFHFSGGDEFTRWMERERAVLAQDHARALESLARDALDTGDAAVSVGWWRRLAALEPLDARVTVGLMEALAASGDVPGAIKQARIYELLVEQELDLPPDREVMALADRMRRQPPPVSKPSRAVVETTSAANTIVVTADPATAVVTATIPNSAVPTPVTSPVAAEPSLPNKQAIRRPRLLAMAALGLVAGAVLATRAAMNRDGAKPDDFVAVVAVGPIASYEADTVTRALAGPVADLLATSLARSPRLRVVSAARMAELMRRTRASGDTGTAALIAAAREAGATEIVDGALYARPGGSLRLDLRRVDLATGAIGNVNSVEGSDLFTLVDSGTARLVIAHGGTVPPGSIAGVTTHSASAYGLYAEGVQTLADGDVVRAEKLFAAALREDSTFAMAAYYYARSATMRVPVVSRLNRALRLSSNATERERWLIRAGWAWIMTSPDLGTLADSLVRRYPLEPEGHLYAGIARFQDGEFLPSVAALRRVVAMDSGSFTRADGVAGCNACTAMSQIVLAYDAADSLAAAEREARRWTHLQPDIPAPWLSLWDVLERAGKFAEADQLTDRLRAIDDDAVAAVTRAATHALRTGDLTTGERLLRAAVQTGNSAVRLEAMWQLVLSLRYQGRMNDAIVAAQRYRALAAPLDSANTDGVSVSAAPLAVVLEEAGRYPESAALFDSVSQWQAPEESASGAARARAWRLTHRARSLALAGDTAAVSALADSIAAAGAVSGHVRDRRLDRYVRGLLLLARNDLVGAEAAFRSALYSLPTGYTRVNCELATVLLRLGRPREAISFLQPALRGKVDASNYYVTFTEVHALLAQAWDAAARPDSAAVHHAWVARAWAHGDPQYAERAAIARRRWKGAASD